MAIRFSCPECAQLVEVADDAAGMQVRCGNCHSTVRAPNDSPRSLPRRSSPPDVPDFRSPARVSSEGRPNAVTASWLPLTLSGLALVVAVIGLCVACLRDPLGSGAKKYDFSTPRAALESRAKIEANSDVRAYLELEHDLGSKKAKERARTLRVHDEVSHRKYRILFISFKEDNLTRKEVAVFVRDAETDVWKPSHVGAFELARENEQLAERIRKWRQSSEKGERVPVDEIERD